MKDNDISHVANFFEVVQASHGLSLKISLTLWPWNWTFKYSTSFM